MNTKMVQSRTRHVRRVSLLFPVFWLALPPRVFARVPGGEAIGFTSGLRHPISRWDYILGTVAVGMWAAQLGAHAIWLLPATFVIMMVLWGMLGLLGVRLPGVRPGIALSVIAFGVIIMNEAEPELWIAAAIVGLFAIFHGYAHGTDSPPSGDELFFSLGFAITTGALLAIGLGIGVIDLWSPLQIVLDAGIVVTLAGVAFLWRAIRPSDGNRTREPGW